MSFTLQNVALTLQHAPRAGDDALVQLGPLVSLFVGPPPALSLSAACRLQSTRLLDWLWDCSPATPEARAAGWSLTNFLRSDELYHRWQFADATAVAAELGDLSVLKWLFEHFRDGCVPSKAVVDAAEKGRLHVLQFLLAHDGVNGNRVQWTAGAIQQALRGDQLDVAHWLYEHAPRDGVTEKTHEWTIKAAMDAGDLDFCQSLLPPGRCVLDYAEYCATPEVVQWKLDCGYMKRDDYAAVVAIRDLAAAGPLDLMQKLSDEHMPPPQGADWPAEWREALADACRNGRLDVVQWLVEHPTGRQAIGEMRRSRTLSKLLSRSAAQGHLDVMQYLFDHGAVDTFGGALIAAMRTDQMEALRWVLEHCPPSETFPDYCMMHEAARRGRVDMLQLFQSLGPSGVSGFFPTTEPTAQTEAETANAAASAGMVVEDADRHRQIIENQHRHRVLWMPTDPMDDAAANGRLEALQWLHDNRTEGCTTAAMDEAAANGHLDVVKWLHETRSEGCTSNAMDFATANGHLEIVQWLQAHTSGGCTTMAMDAAAARGHLKVLQWLSLNRSEGCTATASASAVANGHLAVASWLWDNFHDSIPAAFSAPRSRNKFDVLLFLHVRHPAAFLPLFVRDSRTPLSPQRPTLNDAIVEEWLKKYYPVPEIPEEQQERGRQQFDGIAGQIFENIAQQLANQIGGFGGMQVVDRPAEFGMPNALAMVMNNIMVVHPDGDEE
ncbi:unnamed protein product [Phytophthora lilii]|uniref:Unnamed protein product n=1 Tax=Phytophthora lilii TaxID=2077276 RepID=A0A9W6U3K6_9STRA|nr:unnamed protein product [Phytophthora lilii]